MIRYDIRNGFHAWDVTHLDIKSLSIEARKLNVSKTLLVREGRFCFIQTAWSFVLGEKWLVVSKEDVLDLQLKIKIYLKLLFCQLFVLRARPTKSAVW